MGEDDHGGGFFPSLSRTAFTWAVFQSNVFLLKLNAMRIPVSFHTALKMADLSAFLNSGATECFVSHPTAAPGSLADRQQRLHQELHDSLCTCKLDAAPGSGSHGGCAGCYDFFPFTLTIPHMTRAPDSRTVDPIMLTLIPRLLDGRHLS